MDKGQFLLEFGTLRALFISSFVDDTLALK